MAATAPARRSIRPRTFEARPRPAYRIDKPFEWNYRHGPDFNGPWPAVPATPIKSFFGLPVRSRFGVAAGLLLNSRWVETYARLGFDILTYKTVRRIARACHPMPNWAVLEAEGLRHLGDSQAFQRAGAALPDDPSRASFGGSFGTPSAAPAMWRPDIAVARQSLTGGQVLIVSVMATVAPGSTEASVIEEFRLLAEDAVGAGAQAVEANLSCPNVRREEGEVYRDAALTARIAEAVRQGAGGRPVLLKFGQALDKRRLARLLEAAAPHADGVVLANALTRPIGDAQGQPFFGAGRKRAGVSGAAIHGPVLRLIEKAAGLIAQRRWGLKIVGVGGVAAAADARAFLDAGAYAVQAVTGAAWNPYLACRLKDAAPEI